MWPPYTELVLEMEEDRRYYVGGRWANGSSGCWHNDLADALESLSNYVTENPQAKVRIQLDEPNDVKAEFWKLYKQAVTLDDKHRILWAIHCLNS